MLLLKTKKLKTEIKDLRKKLEKEQEDHARDVESLRDDCRALANRCFALTKGSMCIFCGLSSYHCPHEKLGCFLTQKRKTEVMEDNK